MLIERGYIRLHTACDKWQQGICSRAERRIFNWPRQCEIKLNGRFLKEAMDQARRPASGFYAGWLTVINDKNHQPVQIVDPDAPGFDKGFIRVVVRVFNEGATVTMCMRNAADAMPLRGLEVAIALERLGPSAMTPSQVEAQEEIVYRTSPTRALAFYALQSPTLTAAVGDFRGNWTTNRIEKQVGEFSAFAAGPWWSVTPVVSKEQQPSSRWLKVCSRIK
jgi:hypothetical protein